MGGGVTDLVARAREAMRNAWAPYSEFHVGAAIEAEDGRVFVGCNVESASYGLTICAERMALGAAVAAGARSLRRIAVTTEVDPPAAPCGACRQLLAEFGLKLEVIAVGPSTERRWTLGALLPDAFTKETLDR
jgi:cytidine deaminase